MAKKVDTVKNSKKIDDNKLDTNKEISSGKLPGFYISFNARVLIFSFLVIIFSFFTSFFLKRSFAFFRGESITYQEKSNIDYKVYLKKNDFYDSEYLNKDMVYVANLIDKIDVNFNYLFDIDQKSYMDINYDIVGKIVIKDGSNNKVFFEKDYVLLENQSDTISSGKNYQINKDVSIDYGYYNALANRFRSNFGIEANSSLVVYLKVHEVNNSKNRFDFNNNSEMSLTIPLSEKAINIAMNYEEVNRKSKLVSDSEFTISNYLFIVLGCIFGVLLVIALIYYIKLLLLVRVKKSAYDKYVSRLLTEYDRLIVNTCTAPNLKDCTIVKVLNFQELLDVRDNLKLPIKYYVVQKHHKCNFYITHDNELYLLVLKDVDLGDISQYGISFYI